MNSPRILMCRPDCYEIEYEINPWMSCERQADHDLAVQQWDGLHRILNTRPVANGYLGGTRTR